MGTLKHKESPLVQLISFNKLLEQYDAMAESKDEFLAKKAKRILKAQEPYPELRDGFSDLSLLKKYEKVIHIILQDTFSEVLTHNEIKTASLPFDDTVFNASKRFQKILKDAGGEAFKPQLSGLSDHMYYIVACTVILGMHYGHPVDFKKPLFYDIPDAHGVMRHYRILYNADFIEILPTEKAKELSKADIEELLENYDNLELWKDKIPPGSFISKGFVISNMFDVTAEHSISEIKSALIANEKKNEGDSFMTELQETFRSFFNLKTVTVGFVAYNHKQDQFECVHGNGISSIILGEKEVISSGKALCPKSYQSMMQNNSYFAITDVDKYYELSGGMAPYKNLKEEGYKSAIFAPIADNGNLLGILELGSPNKNELNSVNANKLQDIMPFIVTAVLRSKAEEENLIDAVIQNECTSVHGSVYWRFQEEAKNFIKDSLKGLQPSFNEVVFKDVSPLYGQVDIKESSQARNTAIQRDLMIQLSEIKTVLSKALEKTKLPIYEELIFRVNNHIDGVKETLHTNTEQAIFNFVMEEINPVLDHLKKTDPSFNSLIETYEAQINPETQSYYDHRKNYDQSVMAINQKLSSLIDKKQEDAQAMFPHYFERYKTDGIEHNMYIGESIAEGGNFSSLYLNNLRLWQLQVMCEMENTHYALKPKLPVPLDVASLILVYNTSLSIRFRMDEKRFDVDGTYNARYEIIKKRIDKSYVKGTNERLTQTGKMVIVYSQKSDELEYLRYIKFLKSKGYFTGKIEIVELEGLQGVAGLKAIRAEILYTKDKESEKTYTYDDLMEELKA
ncbi:GAF domain-containing protein [Flavobacteriaceae bacterium TP-CH-4]|uniref:GAF domain-containing protein n=1 Tax=Pelagihabitans pacificus TaxID=2696054 RepID=A0A967E7V6_9FLAO|nr:GAF domain-containing protein [Pelagihabitans pacificus]NHF60649.1 GAF domain-containing protein [Pelagihabitans pacificus]